MDTRKQPCNLIAVNSINGIPQFAFVGQYANWDSAEYAAALLGLTRPYYKILPVKSYP